MPQVTVWFDGSCPLCSREIAVMRRLDWRQAVSFIDVAGESADCPIDRTAALARLHAREGTGPVVSGAAAFAAMWRALPLLLPLGIAARNATILRLLERVYLVFLTHRPPSPALRRTGAGAG